MAPVSLLRAFFFLAAFSFTPATSDKAQVPSFAFSWLNDNNTFQAGDTATIKIRVLGEFHSHGNASLDKTAFSPSLQVNEKIGNSSYVSGVYLDVSGDTSTWRILFTPIRVGVFNVIISDEPFKVLDSSLHFNVISGKIYPSVCIVSWAGLVHEFEAGAKASLVIAPRDAFGNNVSSTGEALNTYNFTVSALYENGSIASVPNTTQMRWNEFGNIIIELSLTRAGNQLLQVIGGNQTLNGSPLPLKVNPGPLDVSSCQAKWKFETKAWQIFSKMEIFIHQQDQYGNFVPGLYEFDADVVEKETNLSLPIADLDFGEVTPGIQLFSFSLLEPGNFLLTISDVKHDRNISNMPFPYTVFIGYCDGSSSIVNGSGLNSSVAGEFEQFSVYLHDIFQYPSFLEVENIRVQIVRENDSDHVQPAIYPIQNGSRVTRDMTYGSISQAEIAPVPFPDRSNISVGHLNLLAEAFDVVYTPQRSGIYDIYVFCGNVLLNGGHPFRKEVRAGEVNVSVSGVVKFARKVPKLIENEVVIQLMDSNYNPVLFQQRRLQLEIVSLNKSGSTSGVFLDNNDGSYTSHYLVKNVGTYELCVSFDKTHLLPCPFAVNVYGGEYFPKAYDDKISVWEDESIAFDVLANDYFAGKNARIVEHTKPGRGSLLQQGHSFRYTPYRDYYGNDSFMYSISDANGNLGTTSVNISILNVPPQFISFPSQLQATEDVISPRYGGFSGFEVRYSDPTENISVTLSAKFGTVLLAPMLMQLWKPMWGEFSVEGDNGTADLILKGNVGVLNLALQSLQYIGNDNFSGNDAIRVSATNSNGKNDVDIPVFVEPINDPPFINVPKSIILKSKDVEMLIFDKSKDKFNFSVGDPDVLSFPGRKSQFTLMFSVEVDDGYLVTSLPAELINTTELKLMNNHRWQPLQTYVSISKHFVVKASGIRIRGTLDACNSVIQQLSYHSQDEDQGAILTLRLNDMGHYGCYSDCEEKISGTLSAEATVNLIRSGPLNSLAAHTIGSAIIIEFILLFSLGVLLLFFTCKCAVLLVNQRTSYHLQNGQPSSVKDFQKNVVLPLHARTDKERSSPDLSETATHFTDCCSSPLSHNSRTSNFRLH